MEGRGIVTFLYGNKAKIRVETGSECKSCSAHCYCQSGAAKNREIFVSNDYGAKVSDHIVFEADPSKVIISSILVWIVPVIAMMIGYFVAQHFSTGIIPIITAFVFLGCSFALLRYLDKVLSGGKTFYPKITRIIDHNGSANGHCCIADSGHDAIKGS
ncbi:MAG: SoxR reducing system RseC family protein [Candidatus Latescibacteria bacterium]|nr:SoxR reducing system RseC family protein [Candidatus Latescibacterota bacterium]